MPEPGGDTPPDTCLAEAHPVDFEGMKLGHRSPCEPAALRAALAPFGPTCVSGWYSAALLARDLGEEPAQLRPHFDLLRAMGSEELVFAETSNAIHGGRTVPPARRPVLDAASSAASGARLTAVAEATEREGVWLVRHQHMGTIVQDEHDIEALTLRLADAALESLHAGQAVRLA